MTRHVRRSARRLPGQGTDTAKNNQGRDLIRCLKIPRSVGAGASTLKREHVPTHPLHQIVHLPAAQYLAQYTALRPTLLLAKGQLVQSVEDEIVRAVIAGESLVSRLIQRVRPKQEAALDTECDAHLFAVI